LHEKTIGESGISDQGNLEVYPSRPTKNHWIPLPVTGDDVCAWMKDKSKKAFFHLVGRLEICGLEEASEIFKLIRSRTSQEYFEWEAFKSIFRKKDKLVVSFNWVLGNIGLRLSNSYARFYSKIEANVWQNPWISPFEKRYVIESHVLDEIQNALQSNNIFNEIIIGVILSFHGYRAIPLTNRVNARDRLFMRKKAIEKWMGSCIKHILEEVLMKAKNDIYTALSEEISKVRAISFDSTNISTSYRIPHQYVRNSLRRFCRDRVLPLTKNEELHKASEYVVEALIKHFTEEGFRASKLYDKGYGDPGCGLKVTFSIDPSLD